MPSAPISSMSCRRRFANSRGFNGGFLVRSVNHAAAGLVGVVAVLLEQELHADAYVLLELGEREAGLFGILIIFRAELRAADLRKVVRDLGDRSIFVRRAVDREAAEAEAGEKSMAPRSEPAHLRVERLLVARQVRLERHVGLVQPPPRLELDGVQRFADRRFSRLPPLLEL